VAKIEAYLKTARSESAQWPISAGKAKPGKNAGKNAGKKGPDTKK
jgi:hypothetical protein